MFKLTGMNPFFRYNTALVEKIAIFKVSILD